MTYPLSALQQAILLALPIDPYHTDHLPGHPKAVSRAVAALERKGLLIRRRAHGRTMAVLPLPS